MTSTMDQIGEALAAGAKGAAMGAVGGPIGMGVGALIAIASDLVPNSLFGVETKPALAAAAQAITGQVGEVAQATALAKDPEAQNAFRLECLRIAGEQQKADRQAQLQILQAIGEQQKAALADVASARQQTMQLAQSGSKMAWAAPVVSVVITIGFFVVLSGLLLYRGSIDPMVATIIQVLIGVLAGQFSQVGNFWLGSSHGSTVKGDQLATLAATTVPASLLPNPATIVPSADVEGNQP